MLLELADNDFFLAYEVSGDRLRCVFFAYPRLVSIYKDNTYILIFDYTYNVYSSGLLLLCFDFVIRLSIVLPLAYVLMLDKTFNRYE